MKTDEEIIEILRQASREENGRRVLACREVFELCGRHGIDPERIAALCDASSIQVVHCQLGCF